MPSIVTAEARHRGAITMSAEPIDLTPPTRGWIVDDLDDFPEDGHRRELLDGVLLVSPSAGTNHQVIAMRLGVALEETCPAELHVTQAVDVRFSRNRSFSPDVLVTTAAAAQRRVRNYEPHEVVLAVEIVSDSSQSMDRILKPTLYADAGIPFYWRVETVDGVRVYAYELGTSGDVYRPAGVFLDTIKLAAPWGISIPVKRLTPRFLPPAAG
jgi:Uma2 family endonuclease